MLELELDATSSSVVLHGGHLQSALTLLGQEVSSIPGSTVHPNPPTSYHAAPQELVSSLLASVFPLVRQRGGSKQQVHCLRAEAGEEASSPGSYLDFKHKNKTTLQL